MKKFLYWRGNSLWCRYPLPGYPAAFPLEIYRTSDTKTEIDRCEKLGDDTVASLRTKAKENRLFDIKGNKAHCVQSDCALVHIATLVAKVIKEKVIDKTINFDDGDSTDFSSCVSVFDSFLDKLMRGTVVICKKEDIPYDLNYCTMALNFNLNHLRYQKSGRSCWYHLAPSVKRFGSKPGSKIFKSEVEGWLNEMKAAGVAINTINNRYRMLAAVFNFANAEDDPQYKFSYNPTHKLKMLKGGKVRHFLLTPARFERNYEFFLKGNLKKDLLPSPYFALFYLALWETGRRPDEVSQYLWEMITDMVIKGKPRRVFLVPGEITKTDDPQPVVISDRLWNSLKQMVGRHGLIFRNQYGRRWQNWEYQIYKLKKEFGVFEAGWARDTRRGFITRKTEFEGYDAEFVRACSGHKSDNVFKRYRIGQIENMAGVMDAAKETQEVSRSA